MFLFGFLDFVLPQLESTNQDVFMVLPIVQYGHPILRQKGLPVDPAMKGLGELIENMLETMHEANGIGLAAQQIGRALRLTVIDVSDVKNRSSAMWIKGESVSVSAHMPLVLINPIITTRDDFERGEEGCLSFPEIYGEVHRPKTIDVEAITMDGTSLRFRCEGLLSRAIQHEVDHLGGILFIDRMDRFEKQKIRDQYETLHAQTQETLMKKSPKRSS